MDGMLLKLRETKRHSLLADPPMEECGVWGSEQDSLTCIAARAAEPAAAATAAVAAFVLAWFRIAVISAVRVASIET